MTKITFFKEPSYHKITRYEKNIVSKIDQKKHVNQNSFVLQIHRRRAQAILKDTTGSQIPSLESYQLQSILTTAGTQPGPAVTLALPISECTLICLRLGSNMSALGVYGAR